MDRRVFLRRTIGGAIAAGSTLTLEKYMALLGGTNKLRPLPYDLVAVKGAEPDVMFDKAIETFGGIERFVAKGSRVLVKPNIGWDVVPENAGNTNPALVKRIIEHCFHAGAKEVFVFDHTCDNWKQTYESSGIASAVKAAGGKIVSGDVEGYYQQVNIPQGKTLVDAKVHELLLSADVFINVPILKHHSSSRLTVGMKNLMGVVWDRRFWHMNDLHRCIADFASYRKPDLTIVDAYNVMKRNGPRGTSKEDVLTMKAQIVSTDIVAADAAAAKMFGVEPKDIPHIVFAEEMKLGTMNLESLNINRIKM